MRLLTLARDLKRRKSRERQALFVAEGVRSVEELLQSPLRIQGVLTAPQLEDAPRGRALIASLAERGVESSRVSDAEFRSAAETESPQGVIAIAEVPVHALADLSGRSSLRILVLDAVQDPGNVGTILRTSAALGADATIALPGTVDLWNAKVVRSAMGASFHHPAIHSSYELLKEFLGEANVVLWGADAAGEPLDSMQPPARLAVAVGNEGAGLSSTVRQLAASFVSLPIPGPVESLNVGVAAGILLHQLRIK